MGPQLFSHPGLNTGQILPGFGEKVFLLGLDAQLNDIDIKMSYNQLPEEKKRERARVGKHKSTSEWRELKL